MSGLEKHLFQLKFTSKQLERNARKCTKDENGEKLKLKKAIQKGNIEGARIYAANAIRKKNEALNFLRLASRIDAVSSKVQTAVTMRQVTNSMAGVVKNMDDAMKTMNLEKISMVMEKFESQFEDMDVQTEYMEGAMAGTTSLVTPQNEIDELMSKVADEHGLELNMEMGQAEVGASVPVKEHAATDDALNERLAKLRNG